MNLFYVIPHAFGPEIKTFIPDLISNERECTSVVDVVLLLLLDGVASRTSSNLIVWSL